MATTKNINMKSYNGTDYDTLYPATQTSQVLGNWDLTKVSGLLSTAFGGTGVNSLDELALNLGLNNQYTQVVTGTYVGTGTYGINNKNSLTFDFYPVFVVIKPYSATNVWDSNIIIWAGENSYSTSTYQGIYSESKTLYWWYNGNAAAQLNTSNTKYTYVALGLSVLSFFERLITTVGSSTITLPVTGKYYLELHGGGGGALQDLGISYSMWSGGGSGRVYNSVQLSAGTYNVTIGQGGTSSGSWALSDGGSTSFGDYTVAGGKKIESTTNRPSGVGNVGGASAQGTYDGSLHRPDNGGGLYPSYGAGGVAYGADTVLNGSQGCVYIKYLPQ